MILIAPVINEELYINRKNIHSINVQLMCESDMRMFDFPKYTIK